MKFSRFLLRQGCGGQAASKDGVTFILRFAYTAASRLDFYIVRPGLDGDCEIVCTEFVKCVNELRVVKEANRCPGMESAIPGAL